MSGFTPAQTGFSRLWLTEGRARPDHKPSYESCHVLSGMDEDAGTPEPIKCPDPTRYGYFVSQGQILPVPSDPTTEITGRYAVDIASTLKRLKDQGCALDLQAHMGDCEDPMDFNAGFQKALIIEGARLTNWSTDALGSVEEGAAVNETSAVTAVQTYEVLPLTITERAEDTVVNAIRDVVICDRVGCGECDDESDGCQIIYSLADAAAGSPGTPGDVIYSLDGGATHASNEIDTLDASEAPSALACLGQYVIVVSNDSGSLHYKTKAAINAGTVGGWTEVTTGFVGGGEPSDIWSVGTLAFICGSGGYIYSLTDPTLGVTVLDAGITTTEDLYAVHAISEQRAVAVGDNDAVVYTENGTEWQVGDATGGGALNICVWMHSEKVWFVGDTSGSFYYTLDKADNWTAKALPGAPGGVYDVAFSTQSVGYVSGINTAGTGGYAARTYDGGYSWVVLPEGPGSLPGTPGFLQALAACVEDANMAVFVGGVGTIGAATDGIILVGKD